MLAGKQYTHRHNQIAKYVYWCILKDYGIQVDETWLKLKPENVTTKDDVIIMWDTDVITDINVESNRPDIIIHDKKKKTCLLIDVSVPNCQNIIKKEAEKITKYRDLEIEVQKCWNLKEIRTIPIVIGALGTVSEGIGGYIEKVSPRINFDVIQKTALLGSAHILRNFLTPLEGQNQ